MIADPKAFLQEIMEQVLARSPQLSSVLISQDRESSEKYLIDLLADRISTLIEGKGDEDKNQDSEVDDNFSAEPFDEYQSMINRNRLLASALGACDCWGENKHCTVCDGEGRPGWTLPEKKPFLYFVRPVLRLVGKQRTDGYNGKIQVDSCRRN